MQSQLVRISVFAAKFFYSSCGIDQLLLTSEERMTLCTNLHLNLRKPGGTGYKRIPTGTDDSSFFIFRMDSFLHVVHLYSPKSERYYNMGISRCQKSTNRNEVLPRSLQNLVDDLEKFSVGTGVLHAFNDHLDGFLRLDVRQKSP